MSNFKLQSKRDKWIHSHETIINRIWEFVCRDFKNLDSRRMYSDFCIFLYKNSDKIKEEFPLENYPYIKNILHEKNIDDYSIDIVDAIREYTFDMGYNYILNNKKTTDRLVTFFEKCDIFDNSGNEPIILQDDDEENGF